MCFQTSEAIEYKNASSDASPRSHAECQHRKPDADKLAIACELWFMGIVRCQREMIYFRSQDFHFTRLQRCRMWHCKRAVWWTVKEWLKNSVERIKVAEWLTTICQTFQEFQNFHLHSRSIHFTFCSLLHLRIPWLNLLTSKAYCYQASREQENCFRALAVPIFRCALPHNGPFVVSLPAGPTNNALSFIQQHQLRTSLTLRVFIVVESVFGDLLFSSAVTRNWWKHFALMTAKANSPVWTCRLWCQHAPVFFFRIHKPVKSPPKKAREQRKLFPS